LRSFLGGVLVLIAAYAAAGLAAGPANARGPERTLSSEMIVDGARRAEVPAAKRRSQQASEPGDGASPSPLKRR
ncbi:MAG: hypothetical protein ACRDNG_12020, partial [Gaiellaceae bacterium]